MNDNPELEIIYGRKVIFELLKNKRSLIKKIVIRDGAKLSVELEKELASIESIAVQWWDEAKFSDFVTGQHQSIFALIKPNFPKCLKELIHSSKTKGIGFLLILDQVSSVQNLGAIFRIAEVTGVDGIIMTKRRSSPINEIVRKVSVGATELVDYCYVENLSRAMSELKENDFWICGTSLDEKSVNLYNEKFTFPLALVLGSEEKGMRRLTQEQCDFLVKVPMYGCLQSLNVNQAASIVLSQIRHKQSIEK